MSKEKKNDDDLEMRDHYDFSNAVQGKYAKRFAQGAQVTVWNGGKAHTYRIPAAKLKTSTTPSKNSAKSTNVVTLEPDLAEKFKTSKAVNKALRRLLKIESHARP